VWAFFRRVTGAVAAEVSMQAAGKKT